MRYIRTSKIKVYLLGLIYITSTLNLVKLLERVSLLTIVTALFCLIVVLEKIQSREIFLLKKRDFISNIPIFLIILTWASCLWSIDKGVTISRNYAYTILPIYFLCVRGCNFTEEDRDIVDNFILCGGILYLLYVFATQGVSGIMSGRFATVEGLDQNATCATLFLILIVLFKRVKSNIEISKHVLHYAIYSLLIIWLYLMTGSRGGLLALAAFIVIVTIQNQRYKFIKLALIAFLAITFVYAVLPLVMPESIYLRLFTSSSYNQTVVSEGNRIAIWTYCLDYIVPNMGVLGLGAGVPPYVIGPHFGFMSRGVHNTYLCMLMEFGILGLPVFLLFMASFVKKSIDEKNKYVLGALTGIFIIAFFLESYPRTYFWNVLTYCVIGLRGSNEESYSEELQVEVVK